MAHNLEHLFLQELGDLYDAEQQAIEAMPVLADVASNADLKSALQEHLTQTRNQVDRLEQIFQKLGQTPERKTCKGIQGLIQEAQEIIGRGGDQDVLDAGLIAIQQKIEHYEIASYGTARTWANQLGQTEICNLLQETLNEEGETDKKLTRIAESHINRDAVQGAQVGTRAAA